MSTLGNIIGNTIYMGGGKLPPGPPVISDASAYTYTATGNVLMTSMQGAAASPDGTYVAATSAQAAGAVKSWPLTTPYDISTMGAQNYPLGVTNSTGCSWNDDGFRFYVTQDNGGTRVLRQYDLPNGPYAIVGMTAAGTLDISALIDPRGMTWKPDGTKFYLTNGNDLVEWTAATTWSVVGASITATKTASVNLGNGSVFSSDGARIINAAGTNQLDLIRTFDLATPWDISTLSLTPDSLADGHINNDNPGDIAAAGNHIYVVDIFDDVMYQYSRA